MTGPEEGRSLERTVNTVDFEMNGYKVRCDIVHAAHIMRWAREVRRKEIGRPDMLLLEQLNLWHPELLARDTQYKEVIAFAKETETPIAAIDANATDEDWQKIDEEMMNQTVGLAAVSGILMYQSARDASKGLGRRSILKGLASLPFSLTLAEPVVNALADQRPGALSGELARKMAELNDKNPLTWQRLLVLRNRVFRYKTHLVARALLRLDVTERNASMALPHSEKEPLELTMIVGGGHSDVARMLLEDPAAAKADITKMSEELGMSPQFLFSCGVVLVHQYNSAAEAWLRTTVVDPEILREALKRRGPMPMDPKHGYHESLGDYRVKE